MPIRVLVVDDSAFMRRELKRLFADDPAFEVVATAVDGADGLRKAREFQPELVTLDVEMPQMSGLQALPLILKACSPAPKVMMCSSLTKQGSRESLKALRLGATDVIPKDGSAITGVPSDPHTGIVPRVRALFPRLSVGTRAHITQTDAPARDGSRRAEDTGEAPDTFGDAEFRAAIGVDRRLVVIGSSTGGPPALETVLKELPGSFDLPVVVAQHMPGTFTESLAERLDHVTNLSVVHATTRLPLAPGVCCIIEGGREGVVESSGGKLWLSVGEPSPENRYKPSVNALFGSAARACGRSTVAIQLTGMGDDGLIGARELHASGAAIACQSQASCVVWGMPRVVQLEGLAVAALSPQELGKTLAGSACRAVV